MADLSSKLSLSTASPNTRAAAAALASIQGIASGPKNVGTTVTRANKKGSAAFSSSRIQEREELKRDSDKKNKLRQQKQASKMIQRHHASIAELKKGTIVSLYVDIRDRSQCNPSGILAVVFEVATARGVRLVSDDGVMGGGSHGKEVVWFPESQYSVLSDNMTLPSNLKNVRQSILNGTFVEKNHAHLSVKKAQALSLGHVGRGRHRCKCQKGICGPNCGCRRGNTHCSSSCACSGKCEYTSSKFK